MNRDDADGSRAMTPAQRYEFDTFGFCHLSSGLGQTELAAAAAAVNRPGSTVAVDPALEQLAAHPQLTPLLLELCRGEPCLTSADLLDSDESSVHRRVEGGYTVEDNRCRCDALVVYCYLVGHEQGDSGLLVELGSHKSQFKTPDSLQLRKDNTDGPLNICPRAGDFIVFPEATSHIVLPRRNVETTWHVLSLRFRSGAVHGMQLGDRLKTVELPPHAETETQSHTCWSQGRNARTPGATDRDVTDFSAERRYLFDLHGFVHLRGVLTTEELAAAQAAFERCRLASGPSRGIQAPSNVDGEPIREPALEMLATHPAVLPLLMELGEGAPHLTAMSLIYNPPRQGPPRMTGPYGELHCHGDISEHHGNVQDKRNNVAFVAKSGRITTDDWVVFPYLEPCEVGDGGLGVIPASAKANFPRPRTIAWPYGSEPDGQAFGRDTGDGSIPTGPQPLLYTKADGSSGVRAPDGLLQLTPDAGDFIIMSERCAHCILPWQPADRPRVALTLRYFAGPAWARLQEKVADTNGNLDDSLTVRSVSQLESVAPCTRAIVAGRGIASWQKPAGTRL